jgi:hypothetical protein
MSGAIPQLPQYASMAWCSVKEQGQLYLYLTLQSYSHKAAPVFYFTFFPERFVNLSFPGIELFGDLFDA